MLAHLLLLKRPQADTAALVTFLQVVFQGPRFQPPCGSMTYNPWLPSYSAPCQIDRRKAGDNHSFLGLHLAPISFTPPQVASE